MSTTLEEIANIVADLWRVSPNHARKLERLITEYVKETDSSASVFGKYKIIETPDGGFTVKYDAKWLDDFETKSDAVSFVIERMVEANVT